MHKRYTSHRDVYRLFCEIYREAGTAAHRYLSMQCERVAVFAEMLHTSGLSSQLHAIFGGVFGI